MDIQQLVQDGCSTFTKDGFDESNSDIEGDMQVASESSSCKFFAHFF